MRVSAIAKQVPLFACNFIVKYRMQTMERDNTITKRERERDHTVTERERENEEQKKEW